MGGVEDAERQRLTAELTLCQYRQENTELPVRDRQRARRREQELKRVLWPTPPPMGPS